MADQYPFDVTSNMPSQLLGLGQVGNEPEKEEHPLFKPIPEWMFGSSVEARNALQKCGRVHPMTCGNDRGDAKHTAYQKEHGGDFGQLVAVEGGWVCPVCDYKQPLQNA